MAKVIVWDEAPMGHNDLIEALDWLLQDLMGNNLPFGGKVVILGGHFAQLPTVLPKASRAQIISASLKKSFLWPKFKVLQLKENMRVLNNGNDSKLKEFDQWLEQLGEGKLPYLDDHSAAIELPQDFCSEINKESPDDSIKEAIDFTFTNLQEKSASPEWMEHVASRAILATTNEMVDRINDICLDEMPGEKIILASGDSTVDPNDATHYQVEYINTLQASGLPSHKLTLKKNAVVMLLRNLNISGGLCNGTRLIIQDVINERLIRAIIATGECKGKTVLIPKIITQPADDTYFGFEWQRLQFPIRLAFSFTIHKSQGQTLSKVAVWLQEPCFGHGQFYVAASRVGNPNNIKFFLPKEKNQTIFITHNVVYPELLQ